MIVNLPMIYMVATLCGYRDPLGQVDCRLKLVACARSKLVAARVEADEELAKDRERYKQCVASPTPSPTVATLTACSSPDNPLVLRAEPQLEDYIEPCAKWLKIPGMK